MKLVIRRGIRTSILNIGWIIVYSSANRDSTPEKMFEKIFELCIREFRAKEENLRATTAATSAFLRRVTITQWARRGGYQPAIGRSSASARVRYVHARLRSTRSRRGKLWTVTMRPITGSRTWIFRQIGSPTGSLRVFFLRC